MDPFRFTLQWDGAGGAFFLSSHETRAEAMRFAVRCMRRGHSGRARIFVGDKMIWQRGS